MRETLNRKLNLNQSALRRLTSSARETIPLSPEMKKKYVATLKYDI